jgi:hypothetical protein
MQLEPKHARDEDLVDGVRADEILDAFAVSNTGCSSLRPTRFSMTR